MKTLHKNLLIVGIALGVIAALVVVGIGQTMIERRAVLGEIRRSSAQFLRIGLAPERVESGIAMRHFSLKDALAIKELLTDEAAVSILSQINHRTLSVRSGTEILDDSLVMTDYDFLDLGVIELQHGRFIAFDDFANEKRVCVISDNLQTYLGPDVTTITINDMTYEIIGVFTTAVSTTGADHMVPIEYDKAIFLPATTVYRWIYDTSERSALISTLAVKTHAQANAQSLQDMLSATGGQATDLSQFVVASGLETLELHFQGQLRMFIVVFTVSLLILLIAALNIIQIASASVVDKRKQIGLKMALGASQRDITSEITKEIIWCTLQGGYIGVALSGILHTHLNQRMGMYWATFNLLTVAQGILLALLTGLIASLIPARQAASLNPIQVLRQE